MSRRRSAALAWVAMVLVLSGCGISASSQPRKIGTAYAPAAGPNFAQAPAEPTAADPAQLVQDYLDAAAGGGEAGVNQVKLFLTDKARKTWAAPDKNATGSILIIHVDEVVAQAQINNYTPVDLSYHEVGTYNDQDGRITPSTNTREQKSGLKVVRAADQLGQLRIDSGALPGLVLRDDALDGTYYRPAPIYFWDTSNQVLVPDLRYVPMTVPADQVANKIVGWLLNGQSQLLGGAVNKLPTSTFTVAAPESTLVIRFSPQAGGKGPDDARRLVYQLQASILPVTHGRDLEVWIGNSQAPHTGSTDYLHYELTSTLPPMQKYDIIDGVVKPATTDSASTAPNLQMLAASANSAVQYAAISRDDDPVGAFVRTTEPSAPSMVLIPNSGKAITVSGLPRSDQVSRPAWIPGIAGLLVAWGGGLYLVDLDGHATPVDTPGLEPITEVTVSPDGRRVAMIAAGQVTVAVLQATNTSTGPSVQMTADSKPQTILPGLGLTPKAVSWDSEQQVNIVGSSANGKPALWQVTTDGAVATDLSDTLKGVSPVDVVSYPTSAFSRGETVVLPPDPAGPYRVSSPQVVLDGTKKPFYVE
jgi:hypothetical protein